MNNSWDGSGFIRKFGGLIGGKTRRSRSKTRVAKNLGVIELDLAKESTIYRDPLLEALDSYYENRQYDHLQDWEDACDANGEHVPVRNRRPRIVFPFASMLSQKVISMTLSGRRFPAFINKESPDDQEFIKYVLRESRLSSFLLEPMRRNFNTGSVFVRFYIVDGTIQLEWYHAKYCYPVFTDGGQLQSVTIKYVYVDKNERDEDGNFKRKWFKMDLTQVSEIKYDNPDFDANATGEPEFKIVGQVDHELGFVQGTWFRTCEKRGSPDGYGFIGDLTEFVDEFSYSLSQSSNAIGYNQDPQLWFNGLDEEDMAVIIRSSAKSLNLGKDGQGGFLESSLTGVDKAIIMRDKVRTHIQDIARITLLDPEKIVGSATSAKAMEVLHGPMIDLVEELRANIEPLIRELVLKMALAVLRANEQGISTPVIIPPGYQMTSFDFEVKWRSIFEQTMEDLQKKVGVATSAATARIISNETALRFLAEDFGIDNIEEELAKIEAQPIINPFGAF